MILTWQFFTLLFGFLFGFVLYHKYTVRLGGVVIVPLVAIYFIEYPTTLSGIIIASALTFLTLEFVYSRYIVYGRRLLYIALVLGMIVMVAVFEAIGVLSIGWYTLLIPGLLAYNVHREYNSSADIIRSVGLTSLIFVLLLGISFISMYLLL